MSNPWGRDPWGEDDLLQRMRVKQAAQKRRRARRRAIFAAGMGAVVVIAAAAVGVSMLLPPRSTADPRTPDPGSIPDTSAPSPPSAAAAPSDASSRGTVPSASAAPAPIADPSDLLPTFELHSGRSDGTYDRNRFGQRWADVDRNGCDTRNDILRRDLTDLVLKADTRGCKVLEGVLHDPYSGVRVDFVSGADTSVLVQIDHLVPLAWAWRHGASTWDDATREEFANDPANLRATTAEENQRKSDSGPALWLPSDPAAHCTYVADFITVLDAWGLGINSTDLDAAHAVLRGC